MAFPVCVLVGPSPSGKSEVSSEILKSFPSIKVVHEDYPHAETQFTSWVFSKDEKTWLKARLYRPPLLHERNDDLLALTSSPQAIQDLISSLPTSFAKRTFHTILDCLDEKDCVGLILHVSTDEDISWLATINQVLENLTRLAMISLSTHEDAKDQETQKEDTLATLHAFFSS